MSIAATRSSTRAPWELILLGLLVLSLALIPVRIHRAFGLPAHPLLVHVPVVLVPIASLAALALAARPDWLLRFGLALGVLSVLTTAATITVGAGRAFRAEREAEFGGVLAVLAVLALFLVVRAGHLGAELTWSDPA